MHNLVESVFHTLNGVSPLVALIAIAGGMMLESMCIPIPSELTLTMADGMNCYLAASRLSQDVLPHAATTLIGSPAPGSTWRGCNP